MQLTEGKTSPAQQSPVDVEVLHKQEEKREVLSDVTIGKEIFHLRFSSSDEEEWFFQEIRNKKNMNDLAEHVGNYHILRRKHFDWHEHNDKFHAEFDYISYLREKEAIYKWSQRSKKLPSKKPPQKIPQRRIYTKSGAECLVPVNYATYYESPEEDEHKVICETYRIYGFSTTEGDKYHRILTIGNFEAALKITEPIWRPLIHYKKAKENWKYVISPVCYSFLAGLQDEISGLAEEFSRDCQDLQKKFTEEEADRSRREAFAQGEKKRNLELLIETSDLLRDEKLKELELVKRIRDEAERQYEEICLEQPIPIPVAHGVSYLNRSDISVSEDFTTPQTAEVSDEEPMEVDEELDPSDLSQLEDDADLDQLAAPPEKSLAELSRLDKDERHYNFDEFLLNFMTEQEMKPSLEFVTRVKEERRRRHYYPYIRKEPSDEFPSFLTWKDMRMNVVRNRFDKNEVTRLGNWDRDDDEHTVEIFRTPRQQARTGLEELKVKAHAGINQMDALQVEENVTFSDQRETIQDTGMIASQVKTTGEIAMGEDQWTVKNIMKKPIACYSVKWSTGDAEGKELLTKAIPGDFLFGQHWSMASQFTYFRGHPRIRVQLNGTKFHAGRIMVVFIPRYNKDAQDDLFFNYNSLTSCPHVMLDASFSNSGILELPFTHEELYFNVQSARDWQTLGVLKIIVFNKLNASTSASSVLGLTLYASYDDADLHIPKTTTTMALPGWDSMRGPMPKAHAEAVITSLAANAMSDFMPKLGNVGGGSRNQDKPTDIVEISRWVPNAVTSVTYGEGLDRSCRLGLNPAGFTVPTADIISTTQDDMDLHELCGIPCRLQAYTWQDTKGETDFLGDFPVSPVYLDYSDTAKNPEIYRPTMLAYCSRVFKFWRGSLRYKIQVIATQMHSGRLAFVFVPGTHTAITWSQTYGYPMVVMDLQEKNEIDFDVSYVSERPWLRCDGFFGSRESGETRQQVGHIAMFVLNRLVRPEGTPASITVNVFVSAGKDFQLAVPADIYCCDQIGETPTAFTVKAHSGQSTVEATRQEGDAVITINKGFGMVPDLGRETMGENCMSLKTLLRRYNMVYRAYSDNPGTYVLVFPNNPALSAITKFFEKDKDSIQTRTFLAHFSQLYTFWRGSLRYKMIFGINQVTNSTVKVYHVPGMYMMPRWTEEADSREFRSFVDHASSYGSEIAVMNIQGSVEFEIPFYTNMTQLTVNPYTKTGQHSALSATGTVVIKIEANRSYMAEAGKVRLEYELWQAAGDDFMLNYVRAPPVLGLKNESKKTMEYNAQQLYKPYPLPSQVAGTEVEKAPTEEMEQLKIKAHGWMDYCKPGVWKSTEKLVGRLNNACDKVEDVITLVVAGSSTAGSDKEDETGTDDDDDSNLQPDTTPGPHQNTDSGLNFLASWIKTTMSSLMSTLKNLPIFQWSNFNITTWTPNFDIAAVVNALVSFRCCDSILTRSCALYSLLKILLGDVFDKFKGKILETVNAALEALAGWMKLNGHPKAHGFTESIEWAGPLSAILAIVTFIATLSRLPNKQESMQMIRGLSEKLRLFNFTSLALSNIGKLYTTVKDTVQWLVEWIVMKVDSNWMPRLALLEGFAEVEAWAKEVDKLEGIEIQDRCNYDLDFRNHVNRLVDQALHYRSLLAQGKIGREAKYLSDLTVKCLAYGQKVMDAKYSLPARVDPYCVCLYGETALGKSGCITNVAMTMMDRLGYAQHNRWCPINCSEEYFTENYRQQAAVYWDDFGAFESEEQFKNFFNLKANTQYPLNMAFRKGEYFNSDFIFKTTNIAHPQPNFVKSHPAFLRRRDALVEVDYVDDAVRTEARRGNNVVREDMSHVHFRLVDPMRARNYLTPWLSLDQLVDQLTFLAREHLQNQRKKVYRDLTKMHYVIPEPNNLPEVENPGYYTRELHPPTEHYDPNPDLPNIDADEDQPRLPGAHGTEPVVNEDDEFHDVLDLSLIHI